MNDSQQIPPPAAVFRLIAGMWAAKATATLASLRIPDVLAEGPKTADEVAHAIGANPAALFRLMRGVASVGVLATTPDGKFALTPVGNVLRSDVPGSMRAAIVAEMAPGH